MPRSGEPRLARANVAARKRSVTASISSTERRSGAEPSTRGLSAPAWAYLGVIASSAMVLGWLALGQVTPIDTKTWIAFGLIAFGAAVAQMFPVVTPRDQ